MESNISRHRLNCIPARRPSSSQAPLTGGREVPSPTASSLFAHSGAVPRGMACGISPRLPARWCMVTHASAPGRPRQPTTHRNFKRQNLAAELLQSGQQAVVIDSYIPRGDPAPREAPLTKALRLPSTGPSLHRDPPIGAMLRPSWGRSSKRTAIASSPALLPLGASRTYPCSSALASDSGPEPGPARASPLAALSTLRPGSRGPRQDPRRAGRKRPSVYRNA